MLNELIEKKRKSTNNKFTCNNCVFVAKYKCIFIFSFRYRAIMYPLRSKPGKMFSLFVIAVVWIASLIFAVPMGIVYQFDYHEEHIQNGTEWATHLKPFCSISFSQNATIITEYNFRYYRQSISFNTYLIISKRENTQFVYFRSK